MPVKILMPALSPTMTEGKLARWLKKEGDMVKPGQTIAEIETDKATMEVEATDAGKLAKILVPAGTDGVAVNKVIAILLEEGESDADIKVETPAVIPAKAGIQSSAPEKKTISAQAIAIAPTHSGARTFVSPLAKRIANERGIDLSRVTGSGPHGRIVKSDIENFKSSAVLPPKAGVSAPQGLDAKFIADAYNIPYKLQPNNNVRKVIAKRLLESKQTVPHYYLTIDCELDKLMDIRKEVSEQYKLSVNDFIIKATALALIKVPAANSSWSDDAVLLYERADVSVAVATDNGLVTPIIKDAAGKSLKDISREMKDLATRAREGKLKPEEFQGGTCTVSNLGMFGIKQFGAIINPPQSSIIAVGAGEQRPVVKDGQLKIATVMTVTGSFDHRSVDGAVGAEFMAAFKKLIENPLPLLI